MKFKFLESIVLAGIAGMVLLIMAQTARKANQLTTLAAQATTNTVCLEPGRKLTYAQTSTRGTSLQCLTRAMATNEVAETYELTSFTDGSVGTKVIIKERR